MQIDEHFDLTAHNCFAVPCRARAFCAVQDVADLPRALDWAASKRLPVQVLGGGSNVLFTGDYPGLVLQVRLPGIVVAANDDGTASLRIGAGENWHELVMYCLRNSLYGIENMALIPGTVGAAPIQNIGAYGVELASFFVSLEALDLRSGATRTLDRAACEFGYRDSVFKQNPDAGLLITRVSLRLGREPRPQTGYGALREELQARGQPDPTPSQVAEAVMAIRRRKLPDPATLPNCGSFFKNPVIPRSDYDSLCARHGAIPAFDVPGEPTLIKVAAGWLIEKAGWKGRRRGGVGVHAEQALVVVNHGGASGQEIVDFSREIQAAIQRQFGISLEPEVRLIG